jgi:hypothetical protein
MLPVLIALSDWSAISISRRCSVAKTTRRCCKVSAWRSIDVWRADPNDATASAIALSRHRFSVRNSSVEMGVSCSTASLPGSQWARTFWRPFPYNDRLIADDSTSKIRGASSQTIRPSIGRLYDTARAGFYCANANPDLFSLAPYMASSARLINAAALSPSFGNTEIPILASRHKLTTTSSIRTSHGA